MRNYNWDIGENVTFDFHISKLLWQNKNWCLFVTELDRDSICIDIYSRTDNEFFAYYSNGLYDYDNGDELKESHFPKHIIGKVKHYFKIRKILV
jgi:hypothetical protein